MAKIVAGNTVTNVSFNNQKLVKALQNVSLDGQYGLWTFYKLRPYPGAANIVVTTSVAQSTETVIGYATYSNVKAVSNISGVNALGTKTVSSTFYSGVNGSTLAGCVSLNSNGGTTPRGLTPSAEVSNRAFLNLGGVGSGNLAMRLDDVSRTYPGPWAQSYTSGRGATSIDPILMQYLELIPN